MRKQHWKGIIFLYLEKLGPENLELSEICRLKGEGVRVVCSTGIAGEVFKAVSMGGPGRCDTSYLSDLHETWSG